VSNGWILIIPRDPTYEPSDMAATRTHRYLIEQLPEAEEVLVERYDGIEFVHAGPNLDRLWCPLCQAELTVDWYYSCVGRAHKEQYRELAVEMPCCKGTGNLNDLGWNFPVGFARFALSARDPNVLDLTKAQMLELERLLETPITRIWRHM
jgi:hypothetical protein